MKIRHYNVPIRDMDGWAEFFAANREALLGIYPDEAAALKAACDGGIMLGGGAAPAFFVHFVD